LPIHMLFLGIGYLLPPSSYLPPRSWFSDAMVPSSAGRSRTILR
jgi:hypothetical protein